MIDVGFFLGGGGFRLWGSLYVFFVLDSFNMLEVLDAERQNKPNLFWRNN